MEANENKPADAAAKQAALTTQPVQPRECPLFSVNPAKSVKDFLLQAQEEEKRSPLKKRNICGNKKGKFLTPSHKYSLDLIKKKTYSVCWRTIAIL